VSRPFRPGRIVGGAVIAEAEPFELEATARSHGVELGPAGVRRVVVREPHEHVESEEHFLELFQDSVAQLLALDGTAAPRVLHVLGKGTSAHAVVEEDVTGAALDDILEALRAQGRELPVEVALAIATALVGLWRAPAERGYDVPIYLGPADVLITEAGEVRARPQLVSEQARQIAGAVVMVLDPRVAYLSPEQVDGSYDRASGMFTLGLILFELLAGSHPVVDVYQTQMMETLSAIRNADMPSILGRRWVPPRLAAFLARLLARDQRARFESWDDLMVELDGVHGELPACGAADILAALPEPPPALPAIEPAELGAWRALPHDGLEPISVRLVPAAPRQVATRPVLARDYVYGRDGRPMLRAGGGLLVDVRPVTEAELARFALATRAGSFVPTRADDVVATDVSFEEACAYAAWAGKRLPTEAEWAAAVDALGPQRLGTGLVWEWTATPAHGGQVVRGGCWRDQPEAAPRPDNRSYETGPARDVGFRCVADG